MTKPEARHQFNIIMNYLFSHPLILGATLHLPLNSALKSVVSDSGNTKSVELHLLP
jgi:hypothetical protein